MTEKRLYTLWFTLYILCTGLGFIPGFAGSLPAWAKWGLMVVALGFFVPPGVLVYRARREGNAPTLRRIRHLSALSLGLTLLTLVGGLAFAMAGEGVGVFFHVLLILVSTPMVCGGYWVVSLFLWACLGIASGKKKGDKGV